MQYGFHTGEESDMHGQERVVSDPSRGEICNLLNLWVVNNACRGGVK
jgi:hypothetical protein